MTDATAATAAALMQNPVFMAMFEKAVGVGADGAPGGGANPFAAMPPEGDPKREAWLRDLQAKFEQEAVKESQKQLETPVTDDDGTQWMWVQPEAGFCVKCLAHVPGKGKEKVFINVCRHARVPEPIPFEDPEEPGEMKFRIPLSLGPSRPDADKSGAPCRVYDVIVNPATIKRCSEEAEFRRFVAALCMMSLKQKSEPHLDADQFTNVNFKAKGQLGVQRVRLSRPVAGAAGDSSNGGGGAAGVKLGDEIALPSNKQAPTAPIGAAGSSGMGGRMVVEITDSATPSASPQGSMERSDNNNKASSHIIATSGSYDWAGHAKPTRNPYFRSQVPSEIAVEVTVPTAQSAKELDTRIADGRTLQLRWIDDVADDENCEPFYVVTLEFPVDEEPLTAKFSKKSKTLTLVFKVHLPDETAEDERRAAATREAAAAEAAAEAARKEADAKSHQAYKARADRIEAEEQEVMRQRKELVENLQAVAEGEIPPALREDIDKMPLEQARLLMARLESRTLKGDNVDVMIEKMSPDVLHAVSNYIRSRLGLEPLRVQEKPAAATAHDFSQQQKQKADSSVEVEYNFAKKAENLFGVQMYNRYVFALEH